MQKKIIALAVAGLVSGAAFAQSNVTVYGVADVYYGYGYDSYNSNTKSASTIGANGLNGSRIGFKGSEDLGNGLKANFRLEGGVNFDTGTSGQTGVFGRWTTVGLSGNWGEFQGGRRDTFQDELLGKQDANGRNMVAQVSPVYLDQSRISNFIAYLSPVWNGFQGKLGYSSNGTDSSATAQDVVPAAASTAITQSSTNLRVVTAALNYENGPLFVGAAVDWNQYQGLTSTAAASGDTDYKTGNVWNIGAAYDFGVVRINGAYGVINYANNADLLLVGKSYAEYRDSRKQWSLGLSAPIGVNDKVMLTYANAKIDYLGSYSNLNPTLQFWGLAYTHNLSKRTALYAAYGDIIQDGKSSFAYTSDMASVSGTGDATGTNTYQQGIQFGVRHFF